jgi:hypothetical protein
VNPIAHRILNKGHNVTKDIKHLKTQTYENNCNNDRGNVKRLLILLLTTARNAKRRIY